MQTRFCSTRSFGESLAEGLYILFQAKEIALTAEPQKFALGILKEIILKSLDYQPKPGKNTLKMHVTENE